MSGAYYDDQNNSVNHNPHDYIRRIALMYIYVHVNRRSKNLRDQYRAEDMHQLIKIALNLPIDLLDQEIKVILSKTLLSVRGD